MNHKSLRLAIRFALPLVLAAAVVRGLSAQDLDSLMKIKPGKSRAVTSSDPNFASNADRIKYVGPGETKVLADIKGPAVIRHIWLTFNEARPNWLEAGGLGRAERDRPRMYWDDATEPAVEAPDRAISLERGSAGDWSSTPSPSRSRAATATTATGPCRSSSAA